MDLNQQFEIIRPYHDHEVRGAIERLVNHPRFESALKYLFKGVSIQELTEKFKSLETVNQFQVFFSNHTVKTIVDRTSRGLTDQGSEHISPQEPYLFVANHRDIVLDAAIMQYLLHMHGHRTSQITFGENLMSEQLLLDIGKLNKMFTFYRGGSRIEQYNKALVNSAYINHVIKEKRESIWIAQRNGRTKDGDDRTQPGLIKMLTVGGGDTVEILSNLNIVPVTISYETEPCDIQKVRELYIARSKEYVKSPGEDYLSILTGITGEKGRIHYAFGTPLNAFIQSLATKQLHANEIIDKIAGEIDRQIYNDYKLWPGNYIASDLLSGSGKFSEHYTTEEKGIFEETMNKKIGTLEGFDIPVLRTMFLQMHANPVRNKYALDAQ